MALGRFSNLATLVQAAGSAAVDRKRLYRLSLEGILKVPSTPLIIGFSANIGHETLGVGKSPITQRAGDDLRFLFGTRFEVGKLVDYIAQHGF